MVLTACFVLSPVRPGFVVTVRATLEASSRPRQCVNALRGRHLHRGARTTRLRRPRRVVRLVTRRVHRIPLPTSVTIAKRPSCGDGTRKHRCDLPDNASENVHDGQFTHGGNAFARLSPRHCERTRPVRRSPKGVGGSNPESLRVDILDCFVALLLAMTAERVSS